MERKISDTFELRNFPQRNISVAKSPPEIRVYFHVGINVLCSYMHVLHLPLLLYAYGPAYVYA